MSSESLSGVEYAGRVGYLLLNDGISVEVL